MRLRNVKNAVEIVDNCPYVIKNPENFRGNFKQLFPESYQFILR